MVVCSRIAKRCRFAWLIGTALLAPASALAQTAEPGALTLSEAVQLALKNYPAIRESRARAQAAEQGIGVARTAYLPRLDMVWQVNRGTHNNVFGVLLPQSVVPPISGPVLGTRSSQGVWGSAAGVLLSWDAVDFGQRKASVDAARAQSAEAKARTDVNELDISAAAADAFLTALASDESVRAARANVDRLQVFAESVRTLAANQLRPGADESRANAELAVARNQLSQAVQLADLARASLAQAVGGAGKDFRLVAEGLTVLPAAEPTPLSDLKAHPAARAEAASVEVIHARERVLSRQYFPRVTVQSAFSGRGTGAEVPGEPQFGNGLSLQVPNWAAGVSMTFPAFELFSLRARQRVESSNELAQTAHYDQTIEALTTQEARARALTKAAAAIASNTPLERQAATEAESRARARYQAGLANITEVAEAQRLLAQAEADDALARLAVWRALLATAQARGDLGPFLHLVGTP
jgi:outer membrane protein